MTQTLHHLDEHEPPALTRAVRALIIINVVMLFLQWTVISDADVFDVLGFRDGSIQHTLWSTCTYMFVHYGVWHLLVNMYALLAFGPRLEAEMGTRSFMLYYLLCGIGGAITHLLFVRTGLLVGSSAAVLGVMFAYLQNWPKDEVAPFGIASIRASVLAVGLCMGMFALGLMGAAQPDAGGTALSYLAQFGGLAFGYLYFRTPPATSLDRLRHRISPAPDFTDDAPPRAIPRTLPRARAQRDEVDEIVAKSKAVAAQQQQQQRPQVQRTVVTPVRTTAEQSAAELNRVLDKISQSGLESLSTDERAVLDAMARRLRGES